MNIHYFSLVEIRSASVVDPRCQGTPSKPMHRVENRLRPGADGATVTKSVESVEWLQTIFVGFPTDSARIHRLFFSDF